MVFYFSGTGNSRHVARRVAGAAGDRCADMAECLAKGDLRHALRPGERLGFVFPVYFWGLPVVVAAFLERVSLSFRGTPYIYGVVTYGTSVGGAHGLLRRALRRRGWRLSAGFAVRMPDCWTPVFDLSDREKTLRRCRRAEPRIDAVAVAVVSRRRGVAPNWTRLPLPVALLYYRTYRAARRTGHFRVLRDRCTHCGLCARNCPTAAIAMDGGFPRWVSAECAACLRCLHHCPAFAIQYGRRTLRHGQYTHPAE